MFVELLGDTEVCYRRCGLPIDVMYRALEGTTPFTAHLRTRVIHGGYRRHVSVYWKQFIGNSAFPQRPYTKYICITLE